MPTSPTNSAIEHLRRAVLLRDGTGLGDGELLGCFIERRDEAALAALIKRHGQMVWGACRRLLSNHDAEDAFQATFLILVRKAASVVPREMVGNWLYGVAHQTALQARRTATRRRAREVQVKEMPDTEAVQQDQWSDVQPLLDQELSRLQDNYRAVIVLCDLEGRTRKEVARQLGVPEGTVAGRLARARAMLAKRLTQRGVTLSGGALAAVLSENVASACVPTSVVSNTISAASTFAAGQTAASGVISPKVAALTEGVLKAMLMSKLKAVVAIVLMLGFLVIGGTVLSGRMAAAKGHLPPAAEAPMKTPEKPEKEAFTAWGKEIGGLQAGLGYLPGQHRTYYSGEMVTLVVRVRNVSKEAVQFQYLRQFFMEKAPAATDGAGKPVHFRYGTIDSAQIHRPVDMNLAPEKEIELGEVKLSTTLFGTGKFTVQYERVLGNTSAGHIELDRNLSKLATGKLELEIKPAPPKPEKEKEAFTAWGKEVDGVQIGIQLGEQRVYTVGETVTLIVRIRNNGKKEVPYSNGDFNGGEYFLRNPPLITTADGKPVKIKEIRPFTRIQGNSIAPGKEADLTKLSLALRSLTDREKDEAWTLYGTGKFHVQYKDVTVVGEARPDSGGLTLTTGKLELEIKSDPPPAAPKKKEPTPQKQEKETFTAWGKEVGGLQAGLGLLPGQKRAYSQGETVRVVVRVRNVGKEAVEFKHIWAFFVENPPKITDADGKLVQLPNYRTRDKGLHMPRSTNVAPGKEVELYEWTFDLQPKGENSSRSFIHGTGKFSLQCERIVGPTWLNPDDPNPTLSKLATGKLELEIKPETPAATGKK